MVDLGQLLPAREEVVFCASCFIDGLKLNTNPLQTQLFASTAIKSSGSTLLV